MFGSLYLFWPRRRLITGYLLFSCDKALFAVTTVRRSLQANLRSCRSLFVLPNEDPDLARSQLAVLSKQIPLLFIILTANALALAGTHARCSPLLLTLGVPAVFCLVSYQRVLFWRRLDVTSLDDAGVMDRLKRSTRIVVLNGLLFTSWSLSLYPYGNAYAKCHVAFYMAITVVSCILCLTQLRTAALLLTGLVVGPFTIFFLLTGNLVLIAMAGNLILVACGLIFVMFRNYDDFAARVVSQRETQRLSSENLRLAQLDGLTGLANRRHFLSELEKVIVAAHQASTEFAIGIIDLDRFKSVNDTYGHAAGDRLLAQMGDRLNSLHDSNLFFARLGGDEFGVILRHGPDEAAIAAFGLRIQALLERPFEIRSNGRATVGCSIGVARYPQAGHTAEILFERADYALYFGKQNCKGQTVQFSHELESQIRTSSQIEHALRNADLERELSLAFQPITDIVSHRTVAFEALARWNSPEFGLVPPNVFIPIAERAQLVNQITKILFVKALDSFAIFSDPLQISFNLSAYDISSHSTMAYIRAMVAQSGIAPARIVFEITESALLQDFYVAAETIAGLRALGAQISLDDFGTGFSSLGYVHRLNFDKIKIDRNFIIDLEHNEKASKIMRSILDLCRNLELECIVEGVENPAQLNMLTSLGATYIQGYLIAAPMYADDAIAFFRKVNS
jgi:diguanylate cyclase (GGDEF)-like protein